MSLIRAIGRPRALAALAVALRATAVNFAASPAGAAQVGLGTAESFAVLAGAGITNTGATTITGDVGTFPTTSETGFGSVTITGTNHAGDSVTQGANPDLVTAYNDAAGRQPETSANVELGGTTLLAGNYVSGTFGLTGTLTLDAQGNTDAQFVFKTESTLITAANSHVLLINGADPCRVVWQIGSSATFNTGTAFVGDVLALTDISALTSATFQGRLLARNGAVTLDTNTITRGDCLVPAGEGTTSTSVGSGGNSSTTAAGSGGTTATTAAFVAEAVPGTPVGVTPGAPAAPGSPATPGAPVTPGSPRSPRSPGLPTTGTNVLRLLGLGVMLVSLGTVAVVRGRRARTPQG
jgi:hypothetical protein